MAKKILVIDDDEVMLEFYQVVLADLGEVKTALNMDSARAELPGANVILLDFYLKDEQATIQSLVPELKKVAPVLLCSSLQEPSVPGMGAALGLDGYWNKSTDHELLRTMVKRVLEAS